MKLRTWSWIAAGFCAALSLVMGDLARAEKPDGHQSDRKSGHKKDWEGKSGRSGFPQLDRLQEGLNLNDDQKEKMRTLLVGYERDRIRSEAEIQIAELEVADLLNQRTLDISRIETKIRQIGVIQSDLRVSRVKKLIGAREFLTADQFGKFKTRVLMMAMMSERGQGRKSGGHGGGDMDRMRDHRQGKDRKQHRRTPHEDEDEKEDEGDDD